MDLYALLGIRPKATQAEIRRAFQKRARQWHPDINPGDPLAAERYRHLLSAVEVLSDDERRALYDGGGDPFARARPAPEIGFAGFDFSVETRTDGSFRDIFDGVLPGSAPPPEAVRGEDLEQSTSVTFDEAFHGARRRMHLMRQDRCPTCAGSGDVSFAPIACPKCGGAGRLRAARGHMVFTRECSECQGQGRLDRRPCVQCAAQGRLMHSEWLEVQIPAGVESGSRVRLPGGGNVGQRGGAAGDFVLQVQVEPHPIFRREGADLRCTVPVTMMEAALGAHVEAPTPDGSMTIEIPAGTQAGQQFRLRKRGMPKLGESARGDLYVEVRVWVPRIADARSRELLRELAQLNPDRPPRGAAATGI
jgi:molecular chaperone DnaJ